MVGYLVAFDRVPQPTELEYQAAEAGARHEYFDPGVGRHGLYDVADDGDVAGAAFCRAFGGPVAVELADGGARFVDVGGFGGVVPFCGSFRSGVIGASGRGWFGCGGGGGIVGEGGEVEG